MVHKNNFYMKSFAVWKGCKRPKRRPDYVSHDRWGNISSEYWYTHSGVIRSSDHWSRIWASGEKDVQASECKKVSTCVWILVNPSTRKGFDRTACGMARWDAFKLAR